jgi:hypothetical protein
MGPMNRRHVLSALATVPLLAGVAQAKAHTNTPRVRAGGLIEAHCKGADSFRVTGDLDAPRVFDAPNGTLRVRAPMTRAEGAWATLRCTPLAHGQPCGAPVEVQVLALPTHFGA